MKLNLKLTIICNIFINITSSFHMINSNLPLNNIYSKKFDSSITSHYIHSEVNNNLDFNSLETSNLENNIDLPTSYLLGLNNFDLEQKKIDFITNNLCKDKDSGVNLIKIISKKLPEFDSIAPKVLHLNDQIIDFALNCHLLPTIIQKNLVLFSINFAIWGDEMGSQFLKFYYDLVYHCL